MCAHTQLRTGPARLFPESSSTSGQPMAAVSEPGKMARRHLSQGRWRPPPAQSSREWAGSLSGSRAAGQSAEASRASGDAHESTPARPHPWRCPLPWAPDEHIKQ